MGMKRFRTPAVIGLVGIGIIVALGAWHLGRTPESAQSPATFKASGPEDGADAAADKNAQARKRLAKQVEDAQKSAQKATPAQDDSDASQNGSGQKTAENIQAIIALRDQATAESVDTLSQFLDSENGAERAEALDTLGYLALQNEELKAAIFDLLAAKAADPDYPERGGALVTAAVFGEEADLLPLIEGFVDEPTEESRSIALRALNFVATDESVPLLAEIAQTTLDPGIQQDALAILSRINSPEALQVISASLDSEYDETQTAGVWALSRRNDPQHNELLAAALADGKLNDESLAVLAKSGSASSVIGEALQNESVSTADKINLLNVIAANSSAAPGSVRTSVAESVVPLLDSSDPDIQTAAIETLGKIGARENMAEAIEPKLKSDSVLVQEAALYAYAQYTTPTTYKPLKELWYDEDQQVRRTAFFLSSSFLNESDLPELEKAVEHEDEFISKQADTMIGYINQKKAIEQQ